MCVNFSTRIKDAGIAIHHSRGRILFYTAGSGNGLEGVGNWGAPKLYPNAFVIEKPVEDVKQDEKSVPHLVESVMRSTCLVKEELRTKLCKSNGLQTRLNKNKLKN